MPDDGHLQTDPHDGTEGRQGVSKAVWSYQVSLPEYNQPFPSRITVHKAEHVAEINFRLLNKIRRGFRDMKAITLDLDSHVIPVFGRQHRAKRGYNPKKRGRSSYHPLMCFIGETGDYIGGVFRPGNRTSGYKAQDFLQSIMKKLPENRVKRLRADSGFFKIEFLRWLMMRKIEFYKRCS